jgi:hypothetical protein
MSDLKVRPQKLSSGAEALFEVTRYVGADDAPHLLKRERKPERLDFGSLAGLKTAAT